LGILKQLPAGGTQQRAGTGVYPQWRIYPGGQGIAKSRVKFVEFNKTKSDLGAKAGVAFMFKFYNLVLGAKF
jgi:hypothetical protein